MSNRLLKAELVDDSLSLIFDVVQTQSSITRESDVEREVHLDLGSETGRARWRKARTPFNILLTSVNREPLTVRLDLHWWSTFVVLELRANTIRAEPVSGLVPGRRLDEVGLLPRGAEVVGRGVVDPVVQPSNEEPLGWVSAGLVCVGKARCECAACRRAVVPDNAPTLKYRP